MMKILTGLVWLWYSHWVFSGDSHLLKHTDYGIVSGTERLTPPYPFPHIDKPSNSMTNPCAHSPHYYFSYTVIAVFIDFVAGKNITSAVMSGHGRGSKVKVWVRVRPTANFAHDMLALQPDNKVC